MPGVLSGRVFRCFKTLERLGDKITGFAGPWFVALAWILSKPGVSAPVIGATKLSHLEDIISEWPIASPSDVLVR